MRTIPLQLTGLIDTSILSNLEYSPTSYTSHLQVARELADSQPRFVTVIIDNLKPEHYRKKTYGKTTYIERQSLFRELVFARFVNEYGDRGHHGQYAIWLKKYRNDDQEIFEKELRVRYGSEILAKHKNHIKLYKPRKKMLWERDYNLPEPLNTVDWRNPYDNIFIWTHQSHHYCIRGGSGSSGGRERNSVMGFGFGEINIHTKIPSTILVYSGDNSLLFGADFDTFTFPAYDLGSNYSIAHDEAQRLTDSMSLYSWDMLYQGTTHEIRVNPTT